jgi:O-acetyl-ADP-ribose deacetylase (regulator of RNase III)
LQCDSIAFPAISTGAYGYPLKEACKIALTAAFQICCQKELLYPKEIYLVCFNSQALDAYNEVLDEGLEVPLA